MKKNREALREEYWGKKGKGTFENNELHSRIMSSRRRWRSS